MVSSEEESTGARRTRPLERAKEREEEETENMKANEDSEVTDNLETKGAPQEEEEVRGADECREAKFQRGLRQLEERRRAQEEETEEMWHEPRKEQRIAKWIDCSDDEEEGQEGTAEERGEGKVQEGERSRNESEEKRREREEAARSR